jgi:hypothetical protein
MSILRSLQHVPHLRHPPRGACDPRPHGAYRCGPGRIDAPWRHGFGDAGPARYAAAGGGGDHQRGGGDPLCCDLGPSVGDVRPHRHRLRCRAGPAHPGDPSQRSGPRLDRRPWRCGRDAGGLAGPSASGSASRGAVDHVPLLGGDVPRDDPLLGPHRLQGDVRGGGPPLARGRVRPSGGRDQHSPELCADLGPWPLADAGADRGRHRLTDRRGAGPDGSLDLLAAGAVDAASAGQRSHPSPAKAHRSASCTSPRPAQWRWRR